VARLVISTAFASGSTVPEVAKEKAIVRPLRSRKDIMRGDANCTVRKVDASEIFARRASLDVGRSTVALTAYSPSWL
jgi:hypothetical protein